MLRNTLYSEANNSLQHKACYPISFEKGEGQSCGPQVPCERRRAIVGSQPGPVSSRRYRILTSNRQDFRRTDDPADGRYFRPASRTVSGGVKCAPKPRPLDLPRNSLGLSYQAIGALSEVSGIVPFGALSASTMPRDACSIDEKAIRVSAMQLLSAASTLMESFAETLDEEMRSMFSPAIPPAPKQPAPNCPLCGQDMQKRWSHKHPRRFWGCQSYSLCRGTRDYVLTEKQMRPQTSSLMIGDSEFRASENPIIPDLVTVVEVAMRDGMPLETQAAVLMHGARGEARWIPMLCALAKCRALERTGDPKWFNLADANESTGRRGGLLGYAETLPDFGRADLRDWSEELRERVAKLAREVA